MAFKGSRFTFNSKAKQFHSSGLVKGDNVTGSSTTSSFKERQKIEQQRQFIGNYMLAGVIHEYKNIAHRNRKKKSNNRRKYIDDIIKAIKNNHNIPDGRGRANSSQSEEMGRQKATYAKRRDSDGDGNESSENTSIAKKIKFTEPESRKYDPYK